MPGCPGSAADSSASTSSSCCRATSSLRCWSRNGAGRARWRFSVSTSGGPGASFPGSSSFSSWWRSTPNGSPNPTRSGRCGATRSRPWPTWRTGGSSSPARAISCISARRHPCCTPGRWRSRSSSTWSGPGVALLSLRWRGRRALAVVAAAGIVLSAALTVVLFHHGVSVTRLYYGTDVRTQEVMVGALLAICLPALRSTGRRRSSRSTRRTVHTGGRRARGRRPRLALLWALHAVSGQGAFLYQGGFLLVATATAGVILLVVVRPRAVVSRILSLGVLGYIGRISYGLYLYHYPLFLMIDNQHTGLTGAALLAVRLGATAVAAVASYHLHRDAGPATPRPQGLAPGCGLAHRGRGRRRGACPLDHRRGTRAPDTDQGRPSSPCRTPRRRHCHPAITSVSWCSATPSP